MGEINPEVHTSVTHPEVHTSVTHPEVNHAERLTTLRYTMLRG